MNSHNANWDEIGGLLRQARNLLQTGSAARLGVPSGALAGTLDEFEEFLDHNELELAWDALAKVAETIKAAPTSWRILSRAAVLMQLPDKAELALRHAEPTVSCDRALATAHADAKDAYRDLSDFRIQIVLEPDGWHINYEFKTPGIDAGGGPHYVIDATTGSILTKRYEQ